MQNMFQQTYHVAGTLGADVSIVFTAPCAMTLVHVSAVGSNAHNGLITIGNTTTAAAYLASASIGVSNVPVEFDKDDFVDSQYPHITDGTVFAVALDYNGAAATAVHDFTLILTFVEG